MRPWVVAAALVLLIGLAATLSTPGSVWAAGTPEVPRVFYLTRPRTLNTEQPPPGLPGIDNLTKTPLYFSHPLTLLASGVTIFSPMVFRLWLDSNVSNVDVLLEGTFHEKSGNYCCNNLTSVSQQRLQNRTLAPVDFTFSLQSHPLLPYAQVAVSFRIPNPLPGVLVRVFYDSVSTPSSVVLRMSNYLKLDDPNKVDVLDNPLLHPATSFRINSTIPNTNNVVNFQAAVRSAFGILDVRRVNMTIVGPDTLPVRGATNLTMSLVSQTQDQPYIYFYPWQFLYNATEGLYLVYLDIIDSQNSVAFSFRGPTNFILTRGFFVPPSLLPYFAAGGIGGSGLVGGLLYYRRRKAKSYLVPFDYFNTLTGGELDGGTVVSIEGNTGSGKTLLSEQLMYEDLKKGRHCVFVATADFPLNIRNSMNTMGLDVSGFEKTGLLTFVDGYSSEAGQESREKFSIPSLGDLTTLGIKITSSLPSDSFKGGSLYFDSLTPLTSKTKPESIVSFVQSVGARVKGMSGKAFFTVGPSIGGAVQRQLEELADCVVQMEAFEERGIRKSRLRIAKYRARQHQQGWVIYTIEEGKGLIFYSKKPRK